MGVRNKAKIYIVTGCKAQGIKHMAHSAKNRSGFGTIPTEKLTLCDDTPSLLGSSLSAHPILLFFFVQHTAHLALTVLDPGIISIYHLVPQLSRCSSSKTHSLYHQLMALMVFHHVWHDKVSPQFQCVNEALLIDSAPNPLSNCQRLFYNQYQNHYIVMLAKPWCQMQGARYSIT